MRFAGVTTIVALVGVLVRVAIGLRAHPALRTRVLCRVRAYLGKESWASEKRMTQFCQYSAWLRHVQIHLPGPLSTGGRCCHPRCHDSAPLVSYSDIRDYWMNVHRIPSDVFSTRSAPKSGIKRSRSTIESSDESFQGLVSTAPDVDSFVSYTAESFKLKPKADTQALLAMARMQCMINTVPVRRTIQLL